MIRTINTKFFHFNQNNSGGYFVEDTENGVAEDIIIEALNPGDAKSRLNAIGDKVPNFWDCCSCCGERWSTWLDEDDAKDEPMIYSTPIDQVIKGMFRHKAYVHYFDGTIQRYAFPDA